MNKLHKNKQYYEDKDWTNEKIRQEIDNGLELLSNVNKKIVTFFGSHMIKKNHEYYKHAENLAFELGKRGYAIVTGGGPGIMQAANSGATRAKTTSIGLRAELLTDEFVKEPILTHDLSFHFLFVRRFIMHIKSEAVIFYPGGYGTLNEIFEHLVLMQTGILDKIPIICVNKKYWRDLFNWLKKNPLKQGFLKYNKKDIELLHFADNFEEIIQTIEK